MGIYWRDRGPLESTEFSLSRFLVPYLSKYEGYSIFMDCDMLCRVDLADLTALFASEPAALWCVQHQYVPKDTTKFLGQPQTVYHRKNWSSFMIFDNHRCRALTPNYVNYASGLELHRFKWLNDNEIAQLPLEWNWLVGEYPPNPAAKILHYTLGGPWFEPTRNCEHAEDWRAELAHLEGVLCPV